jgi:hypothetical protein
MDMWLILSWFYSLSIWWGTDQHDVIPSDDQGPKLLCLFNVCNVLSVFHYEIHVLIETVQLASNGLSPFQLNENDLVEALFKDLGSHLRHGVHTFQSLPLRV